MKRVIFIIPFLICGASFLWLSTGTFFQSEVVIVFLASCLISLLVLPLFFQKTIGRGYFAFIFVLALAVFFLRPGREGISTQRGVTDYFTKSSLQTSLAKFHLDVGRFPTTAEGLNALLLCPVGCEAKWRGPYAESDTGKFPLDPWRRPYKYACPGVHNPNSYDCWSFGEDGRPSADDIGNWR